MNIFLVKVFYLLNTEGCNSGGCYHSNIIVV